MKSLWSCVVVALVPAALASSLPVQFSQQGPKLVGTGAVGAAQQGISVAVSADGNTAIVGGPNDNQAVGAAWVFTRSGGVWTQQGAKLVGASAAGNAHQGYSVALSADGNTAILGGPHDNGTAGAAWVYAMQAVPAASIPTLGSTGFLALCGLLAAFGSLRIYCRRR
jgi:hypothetical protein